MNEKKYPLIAHGELYIEPITKNFFGGLKKIPHEYLEAKKKIISDIDRINASIQENQELFLDEKIVCVRMEPKFEAKSYVPNQLLTDDNMNIVGGRKYSFQDNMSQAQEAKLYFLKTNDIGIKSIRDTLYYGLKDNIKSWRNEIGSVHSIDLLLPEEKIMGFPDNWESGSVEVVLHPIISEHKEMLKLFYSISGILKENTHVKTYNDGLTFISAKCSREELDKLKSINPLRAIHPLGPIRIAPIRMKPGGDAPTLLQTSMISTIKVGVFDGGADNSIPLLNGHVNTIDCVTTLPEVDYLSHGNAVCGIVLHGNLAGKSKKDILQMPSVFVESFRVLPNIDNEDYELYEAIDAIEDIVNRYRNVKLFNLSFGPNGAIVDDSINRFTYVLDKLTYEVSENEINPLFCVAVGNDGDLCEPLNRIQSPGDLVNGLGVGSYTFKSDGSKMRAPYSCVGKGREGGKVKPDFLEFGGSFERPFVLVGSQPNTLALSIGTSFASPLSVHKIGKLMAQSESIVPHIGRTLLIHNSMFDQNLSRDEQGYGFCIENFEDILLCTDKKVTILYEGYLVPKQTVKLPIFSPKINLVKGNVRISWTITTIVSPYANDADAYTNNCIEEVFIPHDMTFSYTKRDKITNKLIDSKKINIDIPMNLKIVETMLQDGYVRSELPVSSSTKRIWNETDLRSKDLKWDTVIKKNKSMKGSSLQNPFLTLHALDRNGFNSQNIHYYVAVTIEARSYNGSLYDSVLQNYQNLIPIEIRNVNRIFVDTK